MRKRESRTVRLPRVAAFCRADSADAPNARDDDDDIEATRLARSRRGSSREIRNTFFFRWKSEEESSLFVWSLDAIHFTRKPTLSHKKKCFETLNGGFGRGVVSNIFCREHPLSLSSARRHNLRRRKGKEREETEDDDDHHHPLLRPFFCFRRSESSRKKAVLETRKTTGHEKTRRHQNSCGNWCAPEATWMPRKTAHVKRARRSTNVGIRCERVRGRRPKARCSTERVSREQVRAQTQQRRADRERCV